MTRGNVHEFLLVFVYVIQHRLKFGWFIHNSKVKKNKLSLLISATLDQTRISKQVPTGGEVKQGQVRSRLHTNTDTQTLMPSCNSRVFPRNFLHPPPSPFTQCSTEKSILMIQQTIIIIYMLNLALFHKYTFLPLG